MKATQGIGVVCFDWGGVIVRIRRTWREAVAHYFAHDPDFAGAVVDSFDRHESDRVRLHVLLETGSISPDSYIAALSRLSSGLLDEPGTLAIHDSVLVSEYAGMYDLVSRVVANTSVQTALLSNSNPMHYARHRSSSQQGADFPAVGLLQHHVVSHLVGAMKPDEAVFRAVERSTGCAGSQVLFFDDLETNVRAARLLGWCAEQVAHDGDPASEINGYLRRYGIEV